MSSPSQGGGAAPKVIVIDPGGSRRLPVTLTTAGLTLGRVEGNDIVLPHDSVSRRHARIDWDGQRATVTDLGSSNGTNVGDARLLAHSAQDWRPGDWLNIGPFFIQLEPPEGVMQQAQASASANVPPPPPPPPGPGPYVTTNPVPGLQQAAGAQQPPPGSTGTAGSTGAAGGMFESGRIRVTLESNTLTLTPGQPAVVRVNVANTGTLVDHLTVSVEGVPSAWVKAPEVPSQLNPGAQTTVVLQVNVARVAQNRSGDYPVTVRARSRENPNETGAAVALWTVLP
ncbi:MAG: protein kinase, partial [Chloroflexi bacterium]